MGMKTTPAVFTFTCDRCGTYLNSESNRRPNYWCELKFQKDAYDWSGAAVADGSFTRLICEDCTKLVVKVVDQFNKQETPDAGS